MDYLEVGEGLLAVVGGLTIARGIFKAATGKKKPRGDNIGRIFLRGEINGYTSTSTPLGSREEVTPKGVEELIDDAIEDGVKGLIFDIDSPGGAVVPSKEIGDYVKRIEVPTVALVKGYAASGAYWIASACDKIVANEYSMVGSIGVILSHVEISKLAERYGINYDGVHSGQYKDLGNMFRPFSEDERRILQEELDAVHDGFIQTISRNRNLDEEKVRAVANGLTYHGNKALELGLVDKIGNTDEAIAIIEEAGNFTHKEVVDYEHEKEGFLRSLLGIFGANGYKMGVQIANGFMETVRSSNRELR